MSRIVMMGPPGVGKGTQAAILSELLGVPHVTTGDLFRDHIARQTDLGRQVEATIARGGYVSDDITTALLQDRLANRDTSDGFVLDGYPRTVPQVKHLDDLLAERDARVERVLLLRTEAEIILGRLAGRAHEGRADDDRKVVEDRLAIYSEQTEPIVRLYMERGILHQIDATSTVTIVAAAVANAVTSHP